MALNLEKQLRFYGAYHHDPVNVVIHMTCVPILLWTGFTLATNSPNLIPLPDSLVIKYLPPNMGTISCLAYSTLYILLEPVAGGVLTPILFAGAAYGNYLTSTYGVVVNRWALGAHILSWVAQFIGHGKFEGRAPALLDNLVGAIFLAPFFVWFELLFSLGYRPELRSRVEKGVEKDIADFKKSKWANGHANGAATTNSHPKEG